VTRYTEGFNGFVTSTAAPVASGGSTSPGGAFTRWNYIAFSRRTPFPDIHACRVFGIALPTFPWQDSPLMASSSLPYFTVFY